MDKFEKITNRAFALIFTAMTATTLVGIITKGVYWHIPTLIICGILVTAFWLEKDDETNDKSPL